MFQFLRKKYQQGAPADRNEPSVREALLAERPSDIFWRWSQTGKLPESCPTSLCLEVCPSSPPIVTTR